MGVHDTKAHGFQPPERRDSVMWEITLGIGTLVLIILASALLGAVGTIALLISVFSR